MQGQRKADSARSPEPGPAKKIDYVHDYHLS